MGNESELCIEYVSVDSITPYAGNAKEHTDEQVDMIAKSIEKFGFNDPISVDEGGVIVEGHGRLMAAKKLGLGMVPVIRLDGLTDEQKRAYTLVHNKLTMDTGFDIDKLNAELKKMGDFDMGEFGFEELEAEVSASSGDGLDDKYVKKVGKVIYEPKETDWTTDELYEQTDRFDEMIEDLDCQEGLKEMLRIRAHWFCEFNFARIADYYAYQATPEIQRVFEALGLVLLDKDQLIENGFSKIIEEV